MNDNLWAAFFDVGGNNRGRMERPNPESGIRNPEQEPEPEPEPKK